MQPLTIFGMCLSAVLFATSVNDSANAYIAERSPEQAVEYNKQLQCVALNIYHEARGESDIGQKAVAYVTLNRVEDPAYPNTPCKVVKQSKKDSAGNPVKHKCQFSWYCDGASDKPKNEKAYQEAVHLAAVVMNNYKTGADPTDGATMYHATSVKPYWRKAFNQTVTIDNHIFYK